MLPRRLLTVILFIFVGYGAGQSQDFPLEQYNTTRLDLGSGLPHNNVNDIFVDSRGFIWISSYGGGAVRYDGYTFMSPPFTPADGFISKACKGFAEDKHQRLWIAYDEGIQVVDMRSMGCVVPAYGKGDIGHMLKRPTVKVYCDSRGALWHVMRDSVYRYTFDEKGRVSHVSRSRYHGNTPDICIGDIDQNGTAWICIEDGLYRLTEVGDRLERREIAPALRQLRGSYVTSLLKRGNTVWIATNQGLHAYDVFLGTLHSYHYGDGSHSLPHDYATSLAQIDGGQLLVGTLRGVCILDEATGAFRHWNTSTAGRPMPSDFVHCLLVYGHQLWIGTETAGVVKLSPKPLIQRNYTHNSSDPYSLSPHPVNAMYAGHDGTLWVGTVEGGLNYKTAGGHFEHLTTQNSGLSHNSVSVLTADDEKRLWVGTWGGGLNVVSLDAPRRVSHISMPQDMVQQTNYIGALAYDSDHHALWIGSNDGVFLYDPATGQLEDPFPHNRNIRGCIGAHIDRDGQLWIGCLSGTCVVNLREGRHGKEGFKVRMLSNKLDHPESQVVDKITCFCEAKDGTLWLGSNGYGLYRRTVGEDGKEHFDVLTADDGLANDAVKGIVEDDDGRLWITTNNGLSVHNPRARTFINYKETEGLLCQQFYWNSAVKAADGTIYVGSMAGLTEIRGENTNADAPLHLSFTRLVVDNQDITAANSDILDADIAQATRIRLHESTKSLALSFSTLSYSGDVQGHYSYRMKGFEKEWTILKPGEHTVRYTSLKPGSYTFEVEYTPAGKAKGTVISIRVVVTPYFWKSWWFMLLVAALVVAVGMALYRRRTDTLRRQTTERLLAPIRRAVDDAEDPDQLQMRIQTILDNHEHLKQSLHRSVEADKQQVKATDRPFMERATAVMEQHYMDSSFGIAELAEALGMSRSLLSKRLSAEAAQSPVQFIRNYRLSVAKRLILDNRANRNITEIAYKVGFNDPKYFTRCFTNRYGHSPSTYAEADSAVEDDTGTNTEKGQKAAVEDVLST